MNEVNKITNPAGKSKEPSIPSHNGATVQHSELALGCTLEQYSKYKGLPIPELESFGLSQITYRGSPAIRMPYEDAENPDSVRIRTALNGDDCLRWKIGSKPCLYGLWRLKQAIEAKYVVLVEGESDCHTLWYHEIPALGIPGADFWNDEWAAVLDGLESIYVIIGPDKRGTAILNRLYESSMRDRLLFVNLEEFTNVSEMHLFSSQEFVSDWNKAIDGALSWNEYQQLEIEKQKADSWNACKTIGSCSDIPKQFAEELEISGVVGETNLTKLLFLALTSRVFDQPVSVVVKGPSSGGKSFVTTSVLKFFPESAY